jgi:Family of unknown function (DUF6541)
MLVLLAPGCALMAWLQPGSTPESGRRRSFLSGLADAVALSVAIPPLLALGLFLLGLRVGGTAVAGFYALCLLLLLGAAVRRGVRLPGLHKNPRWWVGWALAILFLAGLIAWRLYQARTLALPAWVDSIQHTLIVRKIFEYGGLPPDLSPYIDAPFFYHYGFHLITALFVFWSGVSPDQAVLWFGQVINALVALSVYRTAVAFSVGSDDRAGEMPEQGRLTRLAGWATPALAALLTGFVLQMPAYYLTWGRYTLLTGLLLLGPALAAALELIEQPHSRSAQVRMVLLVAGLCVVHYFALLLLGLFLIVVGLFRIVRGFRFRACWPALARLAGLSLLGILLASPWIWRVWLYNQQYVTVETVLPMDQSAASLKSTVDYFQYLVTLMGPRRNHILMGMAGVGMLAAFLRQRLRPLAAWALLLVLLTVPWGLRLGPFRPDHFAIVLFFPGAVLLAELAAAGAAALDQVAARLMKQSHGSSQLSPWPAYYSWPGACGTRAT